MNLASIDLNLLLVLEAIYRERSITRAGQRLNLTQSAVSNALRRLRNRIDDPLFVRTAQGMQPSPYAQMIMPTVNGALSQLRQCLNGAGEFEPATTRMQFRLAMSADHHRVLLPSLLARFSRDAPDGRISVDNLDVDRAQPLLHQGQLDLVIGCGLDGTELQRELLYEEDYLCLMRQPSLEPAPGTALSLAAFCERPHLVLANTRVDRIIDAELAASGQRRRVAIRLEELAGVAAIIETSDSLITLPARLARALAARYRLAAATPPLALPGTRVYSYWRRDRHGELPLCWLRSLLRSLPSS